MSTPASGVPICTVCPEHAGMVSRDRCDLAMDGLHAQVEAERRRVDSICGPANDNGKLDSLRKRIESLEQSRSEMLRSINAAAWKILLAALTGGGGIALLQRIGIL